VQEILHLPLGLPVNFQRSELLEYLSTRQLEDFASASFNLHLSGGHFKHKKADVRSLLAFSDTPLKKPLLLTVPHSLKKSAVSLSERLLEYTGVRPGASESAALECIVRELREHVELIDEFYFQLLRQTLGHPVGETLYKTWELFVIVASVFPPSADRFPWILAAVARATTEEDKRIIMTTTFAFLRLEARMRFGVNLEADLAHIAKIPGQITGGTQVFGAPIYEMMLSQRPNFPKLPIPHILYILVKTLMDKNASRTFDVFRQPGNEGITHEILASVNEDVNVVTKGDVNVTASLLKIWLEQLPNALVPSEMVPQFAEMCEQGKFLGFVELLPQVHQLSLLFLVGFLNEMARASEATGLERSDLATIFGPLIVHPIQVAKGDVAQLVKLSELSVRFCSRVIDARDTSVVYPLNPVYLQGRVVQKPAEVQRKKPAKQHHGHNHPEAVPVPHHGHKHPEAVPVPQILHRHPQAVPVPLAASGQAEGQWQPQGGLPPS
jgi:hypothetical protein